MFKHSAISLALFWCAVFCSPDTSHCNWQKTLEDQGFMMVETFDHYHDFTGSGEGAVCSGTPTPEPSHTGSMVPITCYEFWSKTPVSERGVWLSDFGPDLRITGKSVKLDMRYHAYRPDVGDDLNGNWSKQQGFQRIGWFIGDGSITSGYNEIYVFMRLKVPKSMFPTYLPERRSWGEFYDKDGLPTPSDNRLYTWVYLTFFQISTGMTGYSEWNGESNAEGTTRQTETLYGDAEVFLNFRTTNNQENYGWRQHNYTNVFERYNVNVWNTPLFYDRQQYFDKWVGIELRYKLESTPTAEDGEFQAWAYTESGRALEVIHRTGLLFRPYPGHQAYHGTWGGYALDPASHKFNKIVIGGNSKNNFWLWGETMDSTYYLDDLIIDTNRIGPKYYDLLQPEPDIYAPSNLLITNKNESDSP